MFEEKKQPIQPVLKQLLIYKSANFSLNRYTSVVASIQTLQNQYGKKFATKKLSQTNEVEVTRTA